MKVTSEAQMKKGHRQVWRGFGHCIVFCHSDSGFNVEFIINGQVSARTFYFADYKDAKSFYHRLIALFKAVHDLEMIGIGVRHEVFL